MPTQHNRMSPLKLGYERKVQFLSMFLLARQIECNLQMCAFEKYLQKNMHLYVDHKLSTSDRRVLITKWVGTSGARLKRC